MQTTIVICLIIFVVVCLIAYLSLWNAVDDIKNSLDYIKRTCNNEFEIKQSEHILHELISKSHKDLLTEIACLATKNNEDIKRMGGNFEEWDMIEVEGKVFVIVKNYTSANGDSMVSCMGSNGQTYNYYKGRLADAKFIKHIESPFGE